MLRLWVLSVPLFLALGLDVVRALVLGWIPRSGLALLGVVGILLPLVVAGCVLAWPRTRPWVQTHWSRLLLLNATVALLWGAFEIGLGGTFYDSVWAPYLQRRIWDHRSVPGLAVKRTVLPGALHGVEGPVCFTTNALGLRGPDWPSRKQAIRVLCLGGSTTECTFLDDARTWPARLAAHLAASNGEPPVWVGNAGASGFTSDQHRRFAERSPLMGEIDWLVCQAGVNDLRRALRRQPACPFWTQSRLIDLLAWGGRTVWRGGEAAGLETDTIDGRPLVLAAQRRAHAPRCDHLPDLSGCLRAFADNLHALAGACRRRNVRLALVGQAVLWSSDLPASAAARIHTGRLANGKYLSASALREGMERYNATMHEVADQTGALWIDLGPLSGNPALFYDDCHVNDTGAEAVATCVAQALLPALSAER